MATNLRITQDDCLVKQREMQNSEQVDYQFFQTETDESCNGTIDLKKSTNMYTVSKAVPVSLIDQESALKGLGSHKNKCGLTCQDVVVENQETYHPELCPIISNHVASSECCTE